MAKKEETIDTNAPLTEALKILASNISLLTQTIAGISVSKLVKDNGVALTPTAPVKAEPPPPPPKPKKQFCPECGQDISEGKPHADDCSQKPAAGKVVKPNGKTASPEELAEEMKKLFLELAQKSNRAAVVALLEAFGVAKATEVPVVKLPEFITAIKAAIAKAS